MKHIVKLPWMTEKSLDLARRGWYTFAVSKQADKASIAKEVSALYGVTVTDVRTITLHGKERRVGRLMRKVTKPDWKKALVRLKAGQKIDAFEVTTEEGKQKA
ncbi:50S ribosomal protein L23 [Candidatus Gottesmanbacteria bacterium]|nr:50S ribosomal protein L23 [Candidatus Gottesmanbacteria bacterium]